MRPKALGFLLASTCLAALLGFGAAWGQAVDSGEATQEQSAVPEDSLSGSLDDSSGSIETVRDAAAQILYRGWAIKGDLRIGYVREETDERDGTTSTSTDWRGRFRVGGTYNISDRLVFGARIASACSTDQCDPSLTFDSTLDTRSTVDEGAITFDELYVNVFRHERFDVAIGRLQTKFVTRSGVFAKSLDRNNSNGFNVNWTDGVHGTYHLPNKSILHLIAEYNDSDGPSSIRRGSLDFADDKARVSYFAGWESQQRVGPFTQRGFDISYLPGALLKDGTQTGRLEDYIAVVARFAAAREFGTAGRRWNVAGEVGYAPETPTRSSLELPGDGDADGLAYAIMVSLMDLWPNHSIGVNYARADAGWLLSPQYRDNEELFELRYLWRRSRNLAVDLRVRYREELDQLLTQPQKRDEVDFFVRFTLGLSR